MTRDYGQHCGIAHAMDVIGGRWALLIVRDLFSGSKRFSELQEGLPGIPSNVLTGRLRELEEAGVVERRVDSSPGGRMVYGLTDYGHELEEPILSLGRWGAKKMPPPQPGEFIPVDSLPFAFRSAFQPAAAKGPKRCYELRIDGRAFRAVVKRGEVTVPAPSAGQPDAVFEATAADVVELLMGRVDADVALAAGRLRVVEGSDDDARRFFELFRLLVDAT